MVDSVEGSGKTSFLGGAGLEDSRLEDVQPDQEAFVEVIQPVVKGQAGSYYRDYMIGRWIQKSREMNTWTGRHPDLTDTVADHQISLPRCHRQNIGYRSCHSLY